MRSSAIIGGLFMLDSAKLGAEVAAAPYSSNLDASRPQSYGRLPVIEIDIQFEELEEKTAPQSDTSYLDRMVRSS